LQQQPTAFTYRKNIGLDVSTFHPVFAYIMYTRMYKTEYKKKKRKQKHIAHFDCLLE
jgi:hypothetical protein